MLETELKRISGYLKGLRARFAETWPKPYRYMADTWPIHGRVVRLTPSPDTHGGITLTTTSDQSHEAKVLAALALSTLQTRHVHLHHLPYPDRGDEY